MSANIVQEVLTILHTEVQFPTGEQLASAVATITGTAAGNTTPIVVTLTPTEATVTVPLAPDTYNYSIQNLDQNGANLGTPYTGSFVIAPPATVMLNLITGLSAT